MAALRILRRGILLDQKFTSFLFIASSVRFLFLAACSFVENTEEKQRSLFNNVTSRITATDISALYVLCCLLTTGVTAKVILTACKPILWSETKMIKTPVQVAVSTDDEEELVWFVIMDKNNVELSKEDYQKSVTRINMHEDLISVLTEIVKISDRKHDTWDKAHELLKLAEEIK